jgi:hypothetical protein
MGTHLRHQKDAPAGQGGRFLAGAQSPPDIELTAFDRSFSPYERHATKNPLVNRVSVAELLAFEHDGLRVVVRQEDSLIQERSAIMKFDVQDTDGRVVGTGVRCLVQYESAANDDWQADHDRLELHPDVQGRGFSTAFNRHLFAAYRSFVVPISVVRVFAGTSPDLRMGGYQNARLGFAFDTSADGASVREQANGIWDVNRSVLRALVRDGQVSQAIYDEAVDLFYGHARRITPQKIAALGADQPFAGADGRTSHAGKVLLTGAEWWGVKKIVRA